MVHWDSYRFLTLLSPFLLLLSLPGQTLADEQKPFDCHVTVSGAQFDLTKLDTEFTVNRTRETAPTIMVDFVRFNLCSDLKRLEDIKDDDQCSKNARACLITENERKGEPNRIVSVVTLAEATSTFTPSASLSDSKFIELVFTGPDSTRTPQKLSIKIRCDPDAKPEPKFISNDGTTMNLELSASSGCPVNSDSTPPEDDKGGSGDGSKKEVGSGVGWFFLVLLLAFAAYFGLGAYYNYSTYGARGMDLIPHRDFWQEVPYMLKDVISHLCSSVRPRRSSRGGYVAV